jgi:hypothetical protein
VEPVNRADRHQVIRTLEEALQPFGQVHTRSWGDVVSVELTQQGKTVFSFQIARRSAQLAEPVPGPWAGIRVDSFADLQARSAAKQLRSWFTEEFLYGLAK